MLEVAGGLEGEAGGGLGLLLLLVVFVAVGRDQGR